MGQINKGKDTDRDRDREGTKMGDVQINKDVMDLG